MRFIILIIIISSNLFAQSTVDNQRFLEEISVNSGEIIKKEYFDNYFHNWQKKSQIAGVELNLLYYKDQGNLIDSSIFIHNITEINQKIFNSLNPPSSNSSIVASEANNLFLNSNSILLNYAPYRSCADRIYVKNQTTISDNSVDIYFSDIDSKTVNCTYNSNTSLENFSSTLIDSSLSIDSNLNDQANSNILEKRCTGDSTNGTECINILVSDYQENIHQVEYFGAKMEFFYNFDSSARKTFGDGAGFYFNDINGTRARVVLLGRINDSSRRYYTYTGDPNSLSNLNFNHTDSMFIEFKYYPKEKRIDFKIFRNDFIEGSNQFQENSINDIELNLAENPIEFFVHPGDKRNSAWVNAPRKIVLHDIFWSKYEAAQYALSCDDAKKRKFKSINNNLNSGIYMIDPDGRGSDFSPRQQYCEMEAYEDGWALSYVAMTPSDLIYTHRKPVESGSSVINKNISSNRPIEKSTIELSPKEMLFECKKNNGETVAFSTKSTDVINRYWNVIPIPFSFMGLVPKSTLLAK